MLTFVIGFVLGFLVAYFLMAYGDEGGGGWE